MRDIIFKVKKEELNEIAERFFLYVLSDEDAMHIAKIIIEERKFLSSVQKVLLIPGDCEKGMKIIMQGTEAIKKHNDKQDISAGSVAIRMLAIAILKSMLISIPYTELITYIKEDYIKSVSKEHIHMYLKASIAVDKRNEFEIKLFNEQLYEDNENNKETMYAKNKETIWAKNGGQA